MESKVFFCRAVTTFTASGEVDEEAQRAYLQRFVDAKIGVMLGSTGSGEGGALSHAELLRLYEIGVSVCKGRVPVASNQPEQFTAKLSVEQARMAMQAGVDSVNIYGPNGLHGYRATETEYLTYFDRVLHEIRYPVTLCPNPVIGCSPRPETVAEIANKYSQVEGILLSGIRYNHDYQGDEYFSALMSSLTRAVAVYVNPPGARAALDQGAAGLEGPYPNLIPRTCRRYLDLYEAGELAALAAVDDEIRRVITFVDQWKGAARWEKAAIRVFRLPGWQGGMREPHLMLSEAELEDFAAQAAALGVGEIDEMARTGGR